MGNLTLWQGTNALQRHIRQEVEERQDRLNQVRDVTTLAIREGARLQQTVAHVVVATLSIAQQEIDAARQAGQITHHKDQALYHYQEAYNHELLSIVGDANHQVHRLLDRLK